MDWLNLSEESVGSHVPRVILFCTIPTSILVILVVPAEVPIVPADPLVAPKADSESKPVEQRHERYESLAVHDAMVSRWRDRVASRPSSPLGSSSHNTLTPSFEFPLTLLLPYPGFVDGQRFLSGPVRLSNSVDLTTPILMDSLSDTSSVHSLGSDTSDQTHSGPSTRVTSSRPSHKRCRSLTILVQSFTHVSRSITPIHADLLSPCKRFKDSYSPEDSIEEHKEIGIADVEAVADLGIDDGVGAHTEDGIGMGVEIAASDIKEDEEKFEAEASMGGTMEIDVDPLVIGGISESTEGDAPDLEGTFYDLAHYMLKVHLDRIIKFEIAQRWLEAGQLMASTERASLSDRIRRLGRESLRVRALLCIERDRVDGLCHHMALSQEEFHQIHRDRDDAQRRLRRLESVVEWHLGFRP
nr:hypothetical protein [Tanacetum cinerariifolium]